jgi:hypothetical protein
MQWQIATLRTPRSQASQRSVLVRTSREAGLSFFFLAVAIRMSFDRPLSRWRNLPGRESALVYRGRHGWVNLSVCFATCRDGIQDINQMHRSFGLHDPSIRAASGWR